jgi:hypothetical protein
MERGMSGAVHDAILEELRGRLLQEGAAGGASAGRAWLTPSFVDELVTAVRSKAAQLVDEAERQRSSAAVPAKRPDEKSGRSGTRRHPSKSGERRGEGGVV